MALESPNLDVLINSGNDAFNNLYEVTFESSSSHEDSLKMFKARAITINIPELKNSIVNIPYINVDIPHIAAGASIGKQINISLRVDSKYQILENLRKFICIDDHGKFAPDIKKQLEIRFNTYSSEEYNKSISYVEYIFHNCYITNIGSMSYGYSSSNNIIIPITFICSHYDIYI